MGIITYVAMAILTYILACITTSIVGYKFFTIFSFTTLLGLIFKGLLKAIIPALLASYIFNFYCQRTYPTVNVNLPDTIKQFMYGVSVYALLVKLCIAEYNMSARDTAITLVVSIVPLIVINYIIKNVF